MRKQEGEFTVFSPTGQTSFNTLTCVHCNSIVIVKDKLASELGGFCRNCMGHTCARPKCNARCIPFEKKLEQMEARDRLRQTVTGSK